MCVCDSVANKPPIISAACSVIGPKFFWGADWAKKYVPILIFFFGQCSVGPVPWAKKAPICSAISTVSHGFELKFRT